MIAKTMHRVEKWERRGKYSLARTVLVISAIIAFILALLYLTAWLKFNFNSEIRSVLITYWPVPLLGTLVSVLVLAIPSEADHD